MPIFSDLLVTAAGALTSVLTALILFGIEQFFGFSLYSWSLWLILPIGAILSGFAAASGYYFGAKLFNRKPTKVILVYMVMISAGTFFLTQYLNYYFLKVDGKMVRDYVSYFSYLAIAIKSTSIQLYFHTRNAASTGELGWFGFVFAGLQILGFSAGGLGTYAILAEQPFCDNCSTFLKGSYFKKRYHFGSDEYSQHISKLVTLMKSDNPEEALLEHGKAGREKDTNGYNHQTSMDVRHCESCHRSWAKLSLYKQSSNSWNEINDLRTAIYYKRPIHVPKG